MPPEEQAAFADNVYRPQWPARPGKNFREAAAEFRRQAEDIATQIDYLDQRAVNALSLLMRRHYALSLRALQEDMLAEGHCVLAQVYGQQASDMERGL